MFCIYQACLVYAEHKVFGRSQHEKRRIIHHFIKYYYYFCIAYLTNHIKIINNKPVIFFI